MQFVNLLVYDFDGTLVDTKDDIALSVNLTLKELGLPQKDPNEILKGVLPKGETPNTDDLVDSFIELRKFV